MEVTRRQALGLLGMLLPAGHAAWAMVTPTADQNIGERLVGLFTNPSSAAAIGESYLESRQVRPSESELVSEFLPQGAPTVTDLSATELRGYVWQRAAEDFRAGRTERLHGWVLSESELRVYALVAIATRHRDRLDP